MSEIYRYHGRDFTHDEIETIRRLCADEAYPTRAAIARAVCDALDWQRLDGRRKDMAARVALLRMADDKLITLPPARHVTANGRIPRYQVPDPQFALDLQPAVPAPTRLADLGDITIQVVDTPQHSKQWRTLIATHHYLGYTPFAGAQLRYLAHSAAHGPIAAFGFAASAWSCAPRDTYIGWDRPTREQRLHLIVGNARMLIVPHLTVPNLASHLLARVTLRRPADWEHRYSYRPVLLETFVETGRFAGTTYQAANWTHIGHTTGRGKLDRHHRRAVPVKDIYLRPLHRNWRTILTRPT